MNQNEINITATCIAALANQPNSEEKIKLLLTSLLASNKKADFNVEKNTEHSVSSKIIFSQKEINLMPKTFKKEFRTNGCTAHVRKRKCGKNSYTYDIRYNKNGYSICATNKNLETAKQLFIEKLKTAKPTAKQSSPLSGNLHTFTIDYFEKFRLPKVATRTYEADMHRYKKYIQPAFGDKQLQSITPEHCQNLIDTILAEGKSKTADEIYSLLSIIFKGAIAYGIITKSPLAIVQIQKHVYQHGVALSKDEEKLLLTRLIEPDFKIAAAIALYTGLRPNELETAKIKGAFIIAINSKRKNKKVEYKRIPIIDALHPYLKNGIPVLPTPQLLRRRVSAALPNHKLYDLRTTFYTRCDEYGVSQPARDEFVGHSGGALTNAYRDLSDEYLLKEARKLNEWK